MLILTNHGKSRNAVDVEPFELLATDGALLGATLFTPRLAARGVVILHGATAVPQGYYARFSAFLAETLGAHVVTYDYRGIGRSRPSSLRGYAASLDDWASSDAAGVHAYVRERFAGEPMAVIGHSFGGQLPGLIDDVQQDASAVVLVGSLLAYYRSWTGLDRLRMWLTWRALVPAVSAAFGYMPRELGLGEDLPRGVAEQWARWCLSPHYMIEEHPEAQLRFASFDRPTLAFSFTDDAYAPETAVNHLLRKLTSIRPQHVRVAPYEHGGEPIGHFGFFRQRFESTLWQETAEFIRAGLEGRSPKHRPIPAPQLDLMTEVMADLQYGRAS